MLIPRVIEKCSRYRGFANAEIMRREFSLFNMLDKKEEIKFLGYQLLKKKKKQQENYQRCEHECPCILIKARNEELNERNDNL